MTNKIVELIEEDFDSMYVGTVLINGLGCVNL